MSEGIPTRVAITGTAVDPVRPSWAQDRNTLLRPKTAGVYFLWDELALVYIGKSVDILARVASHSGGVPFSHFTWVEIRKPEGHWSQHDPVAFDRQLLALEALYIDKYKPLHNRELDLGAYHWARELGLQI